jgi:uncharacterized RDD family membrane protein YckC
VGAYVVDAGTALTLAIAAEWIGDTPQDPFAGDDDATLVLLGSWLVITSVFMAVFRGRTLGKLIGGLQVVREDGRAAGLGTSLLRDQFGRLLWGIPPFFLADTVWPLGPKRLALRDRMFNTVVLERAGGVRSQTLALAVIAVVAANVIIGIRSGFWGES